MISFLSRIFGPRKGDDPARRALDTSQEALAIARAARAQMAEETRIRQREVANVRQGQIELRHNINILEQTILADRLKREEGDDVLG